MTRIDSSPLTLAIVAPAFYNDARPTRYLTRSAMRNRVSLFLYGMGQPYRGWLDVQVAELRKAIEAASSATHVLYTDASDAIFLARTEEIVNKYCLMGEPPLLFSMENDGQLCAGGWMGERGAALEALDLIAEDFEDSNPQVRWRQLFARGLCEIEFDVDCEIFAIADRPMEVRTCASSYGEGEDLRIWLPNEESWPCVLHFAGGYTDPQVGKAALIEPWWRCLGYEPTVEP